MTMALCHLTEQRFFRRQQWARRVAVWLAIFLHGVLGCVTLVVAVMRFGSSNPATEQISSPGPDAAVVERVLPPMEMIDFKEKRPSPSAPPGVDRTTALARLRTGTLDASRRSPEELLKDLESLVGPASQISDKSLGEIAQFLGHQPGTYVPRTYYENELNRNANFVESMVVRASYHQTAAKEPTFAVTLQDKEKDEYVFTLEDDLARLLLKRTPCFKGKALVPGQRVSEAAFELYGARIRNIEGWKHEGDRHGFKSSVVHLLDPSGQELLLHLAGDRYRAFAYERRRFDMRNLGQKDDGNTLHHQGFDHASATLMAPVKGDITREDGKLKFRQVLLDKNGERLIVFFHGKEAEEQLRRVKPLQNPIIGKIYKHVGRSLLPNMKRAQERKLEQQERTRRKRAQEARPPKQEKKALLPPAPSRKKDPLREETNEDADDW